MVCKQRDSWNKNTNSSQKYFPIIAGYNMDEFHGRHSSVR